MPCSPTTSSQDQDGRRVARVRLAGLSRHPGRVASGGEAEANVAWPPTRRTRNLRSLRERAQAGPERSRSPRGCLQPPLSASRPDPTQRSTLALKDLRAERVGATPLSLRRKRTHVGGQILRLVVKEPNDDTLEKQRRTNVLSLQAIA